MAAVDAAAVKKLREMTSAGIMDCKSALAEAEGDFDKAATILREKGIAGATKKADRTASDGLIGVYVAGDGKRAAMIEINCETDFVARNEKMKELANGLAQQAANSNVADLAALMAQPYHGDSGKTVEAHIKESIGTMGENIVPARLVALQSDGEIGAYVHTDGKQAALVEITGDGTEVKELARDLAMQAVALKAPYLNRESVPADVIEGEKHVYRQQAAGEGKPEAMLDKIAEGRLNKYFQQNTLLEQAFIKDDKTSVNQRVKAAGDVTVKSFVRFKVGEA